MCVLTNKRPRVKGIEHIERDFHSVAWVMSQGWDLRVLGAIFYFERGHVAYQIEGRDGE